MRWIRRPGVAPADRLALPPSVAAGPGL